MTPIPTMAGRYFAARKGTAVDVSKALERYMRHHRAEGASPKTIEWHRLSTGQFAQYLADNGDGTDLDDLCADSLRGWIDRLRDSGLAQASVATKSRSVKAFGKWLVAEEYVSRDPFAKVRTPRQDRHAKPTFTPEEVDRLLASCDRKRVEGLRDFAMMLLMFSTGLRASEVLGIRVGDIDEDRGVITVQRGKGGKARIVPLSRPVERALDRYLAHPKRTVAPGVVHVFLNQRGEPLQLDGLQAALLRHGDKAGVHCNPHKFRHTAAITYLRNGGRIETLKTMLGHTALDMTLHYARIAGVDLTTAHETCDPTRSLKTRV